MDTKKMREMILSWKQESISPLNGLEELIRIISRVYAKEIAQDINSRFLVEFSKYTKTLPDEPKFEKAQKVFTFPIERKDHINKNGDIFPVRVCTNNQFKPLHFDTPNKNSYIDYKSLDSKQRLQAHYYACLLDDQMLKKAIETKQYNDERIMEVYLDSFSCEEKDQFSTIRDLVTGMTHKIKGVSLFPACARRFYWRREGHHPQDFIDSYLNGQYHLAWFVNGKLTWVVKRLGIAEWSLLVEDKFCVLEDSKFLGSGIIDLRETKLAENDKIYGHAKPKLLQGESV